MKKVLFCCIFFVSSQVFADWLYDSAAKTLTECDSAGVPLADNPWVFATSAQTVKDSTKILLTLTKKNIGNSSCLDLQTPIHGADDVVINELAPDLFFNNAASKLVLREVKLPLSLTSIGKRAFMGHTNLVHVTPFIPDGVTYVGLSAFEGSPITNDLRLGYIEGVTNITLNTQAFYGTKISTVDIGPSISKIDSKCFQSCSNLKSVKFSEGLKTIASQAFCYCGALESVIPFFPESVTYLGGSSFGQTTAGFSAITNNLRVGYGGPTTFSSTFMNCKFAEADIGPGVKSIPSKCFQSCPNLKKVKLPNTLKTIEAQGFAYSYALETIEPFLPDSVTYIGAKAFYTEGGGVLAGKLFIGGTTTNNVTFGDSAFASCYKITSITYGKGKHTLGTWSMRYINPQEIRFLGDIPTLGSQAMYNSKNANKELKARVYIPKDLPGWIDFIAANVTPWEDVPDAKKEKYYTNFGEGAPTPDGMIINGTLGGMLEQWYFGFSTKTGLLLLVK